MKGFYHLFPVLDTHIQSEAHITSVVRTRYAPAVRVSRRQRHLVLEIYSVVDSPEKLERTSGVGAIDS